MLKLIWHNSMELPSLALTAISILAAFSLIGAILLIAVTVAGAPPASADDTTCTGTISSGSLDNVIVPSGNCVLTGSVVVDGNVKQLGGNLKVDGIPVGGNVQAEGGGFTEVFEATVERSVQIKKTTGLAQVQGSIVGADIQVEEKNDGSIEIVSNDVEGNVQIWKNSGGSIILVEDNVIDGNLQCKENAPSPTVTANTVSGDIECAGDSVASEQSSSTSGAVVADFNFAAAGDWGCKQAANTVDNILSKSTELTLALGDLSGKPTADCWFDIIAPIDNQMKIVIGNHDDETPTMLQQYMDHFGLTQQYYSFDYQNVHFLAMSTELPLDPGLAQHTFVKNDLASAACNQDIKWIVVFFHKLAYASPSTYDGPLSILRNVYHPLLEQYGVDLVLQGHHHNYERSYPIIPNYSDSLNPVITDVNTNTYNDPSGQIFAIIGTGGNFLFGFLDKAPYIATQFVEHGFLNVDVIDNGLTMRGTFYTNDGTVKDQFTISKQANSSSCPPQSPNIGDVTITSLHVVKENELLDRDEVCESCGLYEDHFLASTVQNNNPNILQPVLSLFEIRDSIGVTVFLEFQIGTLNPGGSADFGMSWMPARSGNYEFRSFIMNDFNHQEILSAVHTFNATIT
jgi:predicted phosphodiesterase